MDTIYEQLQIKWKICSVCSHLHGPKGQEMCKSDCCKSKMEPVEVQGCGECFGEGYYMDQIDDDRPREKVQCSTCKGKCVIPKKA